MSDPPEPTRLPAPNFAMPKHPRSIGVLVSGGLDSCILLSNLLRQGQVVQPLYVRSHLIWEPQELGMLRRYLEHVQSDGLRELVVLELPLKDLYGRHWSITGEQTPGADAPDEAVYLPGRNALLVLKAALWCQLKGIGRLALGPLGTSPFSDATPAFFEHLQAVLSFYAARLDILLPLIGLQKRQVMHLGLGCPLELTFSCLAPVRGEHCGRCNKCAERRRAFWDAGWDDPTVYAG
jgi:7-cyano-7-deazaguanine synthase